MEWFRLLSRVGLATAVVTFALPAAFFGVLGFADSDLARGDAYRELLQASRNPAAYRLSMVFDASGWIAIGSLLLVLAAILRDRAPLRAAFVAACAVGQLTGVLGGFMRLSGTSQFAEEYTAATGPARDAILASFHALDAVIGSHFLAGDVLQGVGFILVAWAALSTAVLPRWLALWMLVSPGLTASVLAAVQIVGGPFLFPLLLVHIVVLLALGITLAVRYWRAAPRAALTTA